MNKFITELVSPKGGGRKDDNGGIIMHKTLNQQLQALVGVEVFILCNNNADTLSLLSDASGECIFYLPNYNSTRLIINYPGYLPVDTTYTTIETLNSKTTILQPQ